MVYASTSPWEKALWESWRETCNFTRRQSKMGSQEVTLELDREGQAGSLPSRESVARPHSR